MARNGVGTRTPASGGSMKKETREAGRCSPMPRLLGHGEAHSTVCQGTWLDVKGLNKVRWDNATELKADRSRL